MERYNLPESIKKVFAELGIESMLSTKVSYALMDFGAYDEFPATRQIIRDVIVEGYAQMLYDIYQNDHNKTSILCSILGGSKQATAWQPRVQQYIHDFIKKTGYNDLLVNYVFQSLMYGLGYVTTVGKPSLQQPKTVPMAAVSTPTPIVQKPVTANTSTPFTPQVDTQFLVIKFTPDTATLYVDGVEQTATYGNWADELIVGQHTYRLEAPGYDTIDESVNIETDCKCVVNMAMKVSNSANQLVIKAETQDTEIWIDGVKKGYGQTKVCLPLGAHQFISRRSGFYDVIEMIDVNKLQKLIVLGNLTPISGALKISVSPFGSKIFVNGIEKGETPLVIKNLAPGQYMVRVVTQEGTQKDSVQDVEEDKVTSWVDNIPSLYMSDYNFVQPGDYFYSDGTYTRGNIAKDKEYIGRVATLETSAEAKAKGFTHGQILLADAVYTELCVDDTIPDGIFPKYDLSYVYNLMKSSSTLNKSGFEICAKSIFKNNNLFPAVKKAQELTRYHFASNPYLPTVEDIISCIKSLYKIKNCTSRQTNGKITSIRFALEDKLESKILDSMSFTSSVCGQNCYLSTGFASSYNKETFGSFTAIPYQKGSCRNSMQKFMISF